MGASTTSYVAFICKNDESNWAQPFIDAISAHAKDRDNKLVRVPGSGFWEHDYNMGVSIYNCEVRNAGRVIVMDTEFFGTIGPARMNLPVSLQAVVFHSRSCQMEPQDPMYAVLAENVRMHDFDDRDSAYEKYWFNQSEQADELISAFEENEDITEEELSFGEFADKTETYFWNLSKKAFDQLITDLLSKKDLPAPFEATPELATIAGYLNSINHEEADPELWEEEFGLMLSPSVEYTNTKVIEFKPQPADICSVFAEKSPKVKAALAKLVQEVEEYKAEQKAKKKAREDQYGHLTPTITGRSRAQIREAFLAAAVDGAEDTTGIWRLLESKAGTSAYPVPGPEMQRLVMYIASRLEKSNSELAGELETSTEGFHIYNLIDYLVLNRKWEKFELPVETPSDEFVFNPKQDYYELFELCMSDGTTEPLDDPCDYDEFLQALKDGRYDPKSGITPVTKKVPEQITKVDSVLKFDTSGGDTYVPSSFALGDIDLSGCWKAIQTIIKEYDEEGEDPPFEIDDEDCLHIFWDYLISRVELPSSKVGQALLAATNKFDRYKEITKLIESGKWKNHMSARLAFTEPFDDINDYYFRYTDGSGIEIEDSVDDLLTLLSQYHEIGDEGIRKVQLQPINKDETNNVKLWYHDNECETLRWETVTLNNISDALIFCEDTNGAWGGHFSLNRYEIKEGNTITQHLPEGSEFEDYCLFFEYDLPYLQEDPISEDLCIFIGSKEKAESITDEELKELIRTGQYNELPEDRVEYVPTEIKDPNRETLVKDWNLEETFQAALDDCNFDSIFADADKYRELIEKNIDEIAGNFTEENEFCAQGDEPEWVMKALLMAGACIGSEAPEPTPTPQMPALSTDDDDDELEPLADVELTKFEEILDISTTDNSNDVDNCYYKLLTSSGFVGLRYPDCSDFNWFEVEDYKSYNEETEVTLVRVIRDPLNDWTAWYYDNEYSQIEDAYEVTFNSKEDLELFLDEVNGGGHISTVRVAITTNGEIKFFLPEDLDMDDLGAGETYDDLLYKAFQDSAFREKFCNPDAEDAEDAIGLEAFKDLIRTGKYPIEEDASSSDNTIDFKEKRVCVTGKLSQTRKEVEALLETAGATIASGVSKTTDFLIAGEDAGSKLTKAQELNVSVLTEAQMMAGLGTPANAEDQTSPSSKEQTAECFAKLKSLEATEAAEFVKANPEWKQPLWVYLYENPEIRKEQWDRIFNNEIWLNLFEAEILANALEILTVLITEVEEKEMTSEQLANPQQGLAIELKELYSKDVLTIDLTDEQVEAIVKDIQAYIDVNSSWASDIIKTASLRLAGVALNGSGEEGLDECAEMLSDECVETHGFVATKEQCRRCIEIFQDRYYDRSNDQYEERLEELIGNLDENERGVDGPVLENYLMTADDEVLKAFVRHKVVFLEDMDFMEMYSDAVLDRIKPFLPQGD